MNLSDILEIIEIVAIFYLMSKQFPRDRKLDLAMSEEMDEFLGLNVFKPNSQFDTDRLNANREIVLLLADYIVKNPSQRFGQALRNTGIVRDIGVKDSTRAEWETPDFYIDRILIHEEPRVILERMKKELAEQNRQ